MERRGGTRSEHRCPDFRKQGELGSWLWQLGCTIPWKSRPGRDVAMGRGAEFEVPKGPRWGPGAICVEPGWAREITPKRVGLVWELGKGSSGGVWQKNPRTAESSVPTAKRRESALREEWWECQEPMGDSETRAEGTACAGVQFDSPILSGEGVRGPQSKDPQFW